jgi:hypothetical protein
VAAAFASTAAVAALFCEAAAAKASAMASVLPALAWLTTAVAAAVAAAAPKPSLPAEVMVEAAAWALALLNRDARVVWMLGGAASQGGVEGGRESVAGRVLVTLTTFRVCLGRAFQGLLGRETTPCNPPHQPG